METFNEREEKVLNFMDLVQEAHLVQEEEDSFVNSTDYKLKLLDKCEDEGKDFCLDKIFASIYKDAVPLNDDYKNVYADDLDASFKDFIDQRCPKGLEYYVKEGLRKKNPFAKKVLEAVNELVNDQIRDKALQIDDVKYDDLRFNGEDPSLTRKIDIISQDLSLPEISQIVKDNVQQTAQAEITRAKEQKNNLREFENNLAIDASIDTPEKVQDALESAGYGIRDYSPSLFSGIMINKLNKLSPKYESGEISSTYLFNALSPYGREIGENQIASVEELAFTEAIKEYTGWKVLEILGFENLNKYRVSELTSQYATEKL